MKVRKYIATWPFAIFFKTIYCQHNEKTKYIPFQRNLLHLTMALKLGWRKNLTYTFPDPDYLRTSISIEIKSDDTNPNMVDTKLMGRISNKCKHCIL